jgi:signal peptidase II
MIYIIVIPILLLDQLTKIIVVKNLALNQSIPVIKGVFNISLVYNRGAAFGLLKNQLPLFIATAVLSIILIVRALNSKKQRLNRLYSVSLCLILAGAVGNLIDRMFFGYVIDFLDFHVWPVFNVADSAITVGAIILGITILRKRS